MINIGLGHNFGNINAILVQSSQAGRLHPTECLDTSHAVYGMPICHMPYPHIWHIQPYLGILGIWHMAYGHAMWACGVSRHSVGCNYPACEDQTKIALVFPKLWPKPIFIMFFPFKCPVLHCKNVPNFKSVAHHQNSSYKFIFFGFRSIIQPVITVQKKPSQG